MNYYYYAWLTVEQGTNSQALNAPVLSATYTAGALDYGY